MRPQGVRTRGQRGSVQSRLVATPGEPQRADHCTADKTVNPQHCGVSFGASPSPGCRSRRSGGITLSGCVVGAEAGAGQGVIHPLTGEGVDMGLTQARAAHPRRCACLCQVDTVHLHQPPTQRSDGGMGIAYSSCGAAGVGSCSQRSECWLRAEELFRLEEEATSGARVTPRGMCTPVERGGWKSTRAG